MIWDEIQRFIDGLSVDPDPALVDVVIDPECACYQFWLDLYTELADNEWRYTGDPVETTELRVVFEQDNLVGLAVTQEIGASTVVDADGNVIREEPALTQSSSVTLRRDEEGRWRVFDVVGS